MIIGYYQYITTFILVLLNLLVPFLALSESRESDFDDCLSVRPHETIQLPLDKLS